jgi:hypothetical protein
LGAFQEPAYAGEAPRRKPGFPGFRFAPFPRCASGTLRAPPIPCASRSEEFYRYLSYRKVEKVKEVKKYRFHIAFSELIKLIRLHGGFFFNFR